MKLHGQEVEESRRMLVAIKGQAELLLRVDAVPEQTLKAILGLPLFALKMTLGFSDDAAGSDEFSMWIMKTLGETNGTTDVSIRALVYSQEYAEGLAERIESKMTPATAPPRDDRPVIH